MGFLSTTVSSQPKYDVFLLTSLRTDTTVTDESQGVTHERKLVVRQGDHWETCLKPYNVCFTIEIILPYLIIKLNHMAVFFM
jgi:hypothetical protein